MKLNDKQSKIVSTANWNVEPYRKFAGSVGKKKVKQQMFKFAYIRPDGYRDDLVVWGQMISELVEWLEWE